MKTIFANLTKLFANKHFWQRLLMLLALSPLWVPLLISLVWTVFGESEQERIAKYQATLPPDNGKIIEVEGEKFRVVYIGGIRFRFPDNYKFRWFGEFGVSSPSGEGVHISFCWPDIPPGKAPSAKCGDWRRDENVPKNQVEVMLVGVDEPVKIDASKTVEERHRLNNPYYTVRDDPKTGLRIFSLKEIPDVPTDVYSIKNDANESLSGQPVVMSGGYIYFMYASQVQVRINMEGWGGRRINPYWKDIYWSVIAALNNYREDKQ